MTQLTTSTKTIFTLIGIATSLVLATTLSTNSHLASALSIPSSIKEKASNMLSSGTGGNTTNSSNTTGADNNTSSSLKQKGSNILGSLTK